MREGIEERGRKINRGIWREGERERRRERELRAELSYHSPHLKPLIQNVLFRSPGLNFDQCFYSFFPFSVVPSISTLFLWFFFLLSFSAEFECQPLHFAGDKSLSSRFKTQSAHKEMSSVSTFQIVLWLSLLCLMLSVVPFVRSPPR